MLLPHERIHEIVGALLRQQEKDVAWRLAVDAQEDTDDDRIRAADEIGDLVERDHRDARHIHIDTPVDDLGKRRGGIACADVADFAQRIELCGG